MAPQGNQNLSSVSKQLFSLGAPGGKRQVALPLVSAQVAGGAPPNNTAVEHYITVTTPPNIGRIYYDNGSNDGQPCAFFDSVKGQQIMVTVALEGGAIVFPSPDTVYVWDGLVVWRQLVPMDPVVFQPGGTNIGNRVTGWADVMTVLGANNGVDIDIDDRAGAASVPNGTYDLLFGRLGSTYLSPGNSPPGATMALASGVILQNVAKIKDGLRLSFANGASLQVPILANGAQPVLDLEDGASLFCSGGGVSGLIRLDSAGTRTLTLNMRNGASLGGNAGGFRPAIFLNDTGAGNVVLTLNATNGVVLQPESIQGTATSHLNITATPDFVAFPLLNGGFLGVLSVNYTDIINPITFNDSAASVPGNYALWQEVMFALGSNEGIDLVIDDTANYGSGNIVPAGIYDLHFARLLGAYQGNFDYNLNVFFGTSGPVLNITNASPTTIRNLAEIGKGLTVNAGAVAGIFTWPDTPGGNPVLRLSDGAALINLVAGSSIVLDDLGGANALALLIELYEDCALGQQGTGTVVNVNDTGSGNTTLTIHAYNRSAIGANTITGTATATLNIVATSDFVLPSLAGFLGTVTVTYIDRAAGITYNNATVPTPSLGTNVQTALDAAKPLLLQHRDTPFTLANIQAGGATLTHTFNVGAVLPANARLLGWEIQTTQAFAGAGFVSMTASLQASVDAAQSIMANTIISALGTYSAIGTNPYVTRGGQQIQLVLTSVGTNLNALTAGTLTVRLFYSQSP